MVDLPSTLTLGREDLVVMPSAVKFGPAANDPEFVAFMTNYLALRFSGTTNQEVFFDIQVPHGRKIGSDIDFHIHWTPSGIIGVGDTVRWGLQYVTANIGGSFSGSTLYDTYTEAENGVDRSSSHLMTGMMTIPGYNITESAIIKCRVFRDTANDTHTGTVLAHSFDAHVYKDRIGGRL